MKDKYLIVLKHDMISRNCIDCYSAGKVFFEYETKEKAMEAWAKLKHAHTKSEVKVFKRVDFAITEQDMDLKEDK